MCSQPEATSNRVRFEICEAGTDEKEDLHVTNGLAGNNEDCYHDQVQLQVSDDAIAIDTEDDVTALVDAAPSPLYSDVEDGTTHENSWRSEQQKSKDEYKSRKV
ncbi:hypothetical protein KIN20_033769 [Parelaphostrongylus tenuis]|uniref:Uncharacterized protein n=1 Tax=Parelaphostrongylus tenuis TaxID=148309 RepID=A0AAD5WJ64_PARTN|nr:hypothetical protein KIN20_033769 [Parelaphostrongylus tenuis]